MKFSNLSYFYDEETGLYYLNSRYYNPQWGRFISADGQLNDDLLGNNQFAYCGNNPTTREDDGGRAWSVPFALACGVVGAVASGLFKAITNVSIGNDWSDGILGAVAGGFAYGFVSVATFGNTVAAAYASAAVESVVNKAASYIPNVAQFNGEEGPRAVTTANLMNSAADVFADTAINGTIYAGTGQLASKVLPVSFQSWFQPQKIASCFNGSYAWKATGQTIIQNGVNWGVVVAGGIGNELYNRQQKTVTVMP